MNKHSLCSQEFWGQEFPGGPAVNSPYLHCWGLGFNPWTGDWDLACHVAKQNRRLVLMEETDTDTRTRMQSRK